MLLNIYFDICLQPFDTVENQAGPGSSGAQGKGGNGEGAWSGESLDPGDQRASSQSHPRY